MESNVVPTSLRAQLKRGLLEVKVDDAVLPPANLFGFAERRNPKRAFLFVSKCWAAIYQCAHRSWLPASRAWLLKSRLISLDQCWSLAWPKLP